MSEWGTDWLVGKQLVPKAFRVANIVVPSYPSGNMFQGTQWITETMGSTEPYMYSVFLIYIHTYDEV